MSQLPPPGWYPDADTRFQRWWDGGQWTEAVRPLAPSLPVASAPEGNGAATTALVAGIVAAAVTALAVLTGSGIDPLFALLILAGAGLAVGLGIPGLILANRSQPRLGRGRAIWAICLGVGALLIGILVITAVAALGGRTGDGGTTARGGQTVSCGTPSQPCPSASGAES